MSHTISGTAGDFDPTAAFTETVPSDADALNAASVSDNTTTPKTGFQPLANAVEYIRQNALPGYPIFGDGSDGSHTLDGAATIAGMAPVANVYTATRDLFFQGLTVNAGVSLFMAGFRLYVNGILTQVTGAPGGTIHCNGGIGILGAGGLGGDDSGVFGAGTGGNGGNTGAGADSPFFAVGMIGARGGAGAAGSGGAAGAGAAIPAYQAYWGAVRNPFTLLSGTLSGRNGYAYSLSGGTGGGGGGGDGVLAKGGGGGGAGGVLFIAARATNIGAGAVLASNGGAGQSRLGVAGAGGGGGGGAGAIIFVTHAVPAGQLPSAVTIFNGGSGGAGGGMGGGDGTVGTNGSNADNLYLVQV